MSDVSKDKHDDDARKQELNRVTQATMVGMQHTAHTLAALSHLTPIEIDEEVRDIADLVPAGNIPSMILNGLSRIQSNQQSPEENAKKDINLLFRAMGQMLDEASYRLLVHVPARAILAYQKMLKVAGVDPEDAFPDGTWQFYVDYAMREDTARHTNETLGFDSVLKDHGIELTEIDRMTAWVMACIYTLHNFEGILKNQWRERVYLHKLIDLQDTPEHKAKYKDLWRKWLTILPYRRMVDASAEEFYPEYRTKVFDAFIMHHASTLSSDLKRQWMQQIQQAKQEELEQYQRQMSILGYLEPEANSERHVRIEHLQNLNLAVVYGGRYFLIPICEPNTLLPPSTYTVRGYLSGMTKSTLTTIPGSLTQFATIKRWQWPSLISQLPQEFAHDLKRLNTAPIILNFDARHEEGATLFNIRQAERGVGSHAMTIFDTKKSFCFDLSHIYFDGIWGAAIAEIMTNEALSWAQYLHHIPVSTQEIRDPINLPFKLDAKTAQVIRQYEHTSPEVGAENVDISLRRMNQLRKFFKMRSDLLNVTVNDLLVLYRAIHGVTYEPKVKLVEELRTLQKNQRYHEAASAALEAIRKPEHSPATLIPIDATLRKPRERLYPMTIEVPLEKLGLHTLHNEVMQALNDLEAGHGKDPFNELQRKYLASLADFGRVMRAAKEIAIAGESTSINSIKMMAHLPAPFQRLLDVIPGQWDVLNDIIKGREIFSNIGQVAKTSTLTRFTTAKDDNEKKTLAWGVLTDAQGIMHISLRDFRPHVGMLIKVSQYDLAQRITQDYLDSYVDGFNLYIRDLIRITRKSPETTIGMKSIE